MIGDAMAFLDLAFLSRRKFGRTEPPQCNGREETDYEPGWRSRGCG
jgi:hypothetical protein